MWNCRSGLVSAKLGFGLKRRKERRKPWSRGKGYVARLGRFVRFSDSGDLLAFRWASFFGGSRVTLCFGGYEFIVLRQVAMKRAVVAIHFVTRFVVPALADGRIVRLENTEAHAGTRRQICAARSSCASCTIFRTAGAIPSCVPPRTNC